MSKRTTQNISLTERWARFVQSHVDSGRYQSASEVVRAGLRLLEERDLERAAVRNRLRDSIQEGLEQAKRGEFANLEELVDKLS